MGSAVLGVVFCLDFRPFLFSSLVPLSGVFPFLLLLFFFTHNFQNSKREFVIFLLEEIGEKNTARGNPTN
jgi:hypothetical protein